MSNSFDTNSMDCSIMVKKIKINTKVLTLSNQRLKQYEKNVFNSSISENVIFLNNLVSESYFLSYLINQSVSKVFLSLKKRIFCVGEFLKHT